MTLPASRNGPAGDFTCIRDQNGHTVAASAGGAAEITSVLEPPSTAVGVADA
jgi:hypothetical protein